jgi:enolase
MAKIKKIIAHEILDSRGIPTIKGKVLLDNGSEVTAIASSGPSKGKYEAIELRDGDNKRYQGLGVQKAVSYINDLIGPKLRGVSCDKHIDIDHWLISADGTENKSRLGVNTLMTVSQLVLKAAALQSGLPIYKYSNQLYSKIFKKTLNIEKTPAPVFCLINGGKVGAKNLDFQEFQIIPPTSFSFSQSLQLGVEAYYDLKKVLDDRNAGVALGDGGGYSPNLSVNIDALEAIKEALYQKNLQIGVDIFFGLDMASSQFCRNGKYTIKDSPHPLKGNDYLEFINKINQEYSFLILEDPFEDDDFENWKKINAKLGDTTYIIGGDFIAGNKKRLLRAINEKTASGLVIKSNQVSTITEILEIVNQAKAADFKIVFSHCLGESNDSIIADLAVGIQADFIKFGAPARGERVAKYNRLLEIEQDILKI